MLNLDRNSNLNIIVIQVVLNTMFTFNLSHNQKSATMSTGTHELVIILFDVVISKLDFPHL